ncbi:ArsA family ATPase [Myxococcus sp. K15C18031901]|uniref:ArsA family ATPase n=1 Tax=Myxococcus dinghuensis TaxID=2906761 RepID=UPI0020A78697|nr:ArsA-related P-loop ATPase [Myxococcus dinghuensis]MCP3102827.1 ArsA family ATPase [Myxococcus dinghuensis]
MTRLILVSGRGGAGKTTVAAATALAASRRGLRTLVLSFDGTRDLGATFGVETPGLSASDGLPVQLDEHLHLLEVDVASELRRGWGGGRGDVAVLLGGGWTDVTAEEVALAPGVDAVVTLTRLGTLTRERHYELIIVDGPSTAGALRFVAGAEAVGWFTRRWGSPQNGTRRMRPMRVDAEGLAALQGARDRLMEVDALLRDPRVTTLRWVTTADSRAEQELRRACTAFGLQGIAPDCVVINRLAPEGMVDSPGVEDFQRLLGSLPVVGIASRSPAPVGREALEAYAGLLYSGDDPARLMTVSPARGFGKDAVDVYRLEVQLPFVNKEEVNLSRREAELVIQVGPLRRNVLLPRMIAQLSTAGARMEGDTLVVDFKRERSA